MVITISKSSYIFQENPNISMENQSNKRENGGKPHEVEHALKSEGVLLCPGHNIIHDPQFERIVDYLNHPNSLGQIAACLGDLKNRQRRMDRGLGPGQNGFRQRNFGRSALGFLGGHPVSMDKTNL
jgi:hypothetical protein